VKFGIQIKEYDARYCGESVETRVYYIAHLTEGSGKKKKLLNIASFSFDNDDTEKRRLALDMLFETIKSTIRKEQFPEHSLVYEEVVKDGWKLYANPRYPDGEKPKRLPRKIPIEH
jgi:hypothetical protein